MNQLTEFKSETGVFNCHSNKNVGYFILWAGEYCTLKFVHD